MRGLRQRIRAGALPLRGLGGRVRPVSSVERRLLDAIPLATVAFDADANIIRWNAAAERLFGWSAAEVLGRQNPIVPADDRVFSDELHLRLTAGGQIEGVEIVRETRDGRKLDLNLFAIPLEADAGPPGSFIGVYEDISARKAAEQAQRDYRDLIEALPLVTYVDSAGPGMPNLFTSPQSETLFGWSPADWTGDTGFFERVLHPDDAERVLAATAESARTHAPFSCEYRIRHRDGHYIWVRDQATIIVDAAGDALSRGFLLDITEQKLLESQLLQAQKMDALGQLAGGIAHDFNNLLTGIGGYADLAARATTDPAVARCLDGIRSAVDEAASLTARLLAFSRRDAPERRPVDLNEVVRGSAALLERVLREDVRLILELADPLPAVIADPAQLKQVVLNLALNARDAMPDGGVLSVSTLSTPGLVMLRVSDTGHGMDEAVRARALEPFFTTKGDGEGTGLGLAVVYGVVEGCGGTLTIESAPGVGTAVTIELPAAPASAPAGPSPAPEGRRAGERVLVVEDRAIVRELACSILEEAGYSVASAEGGAEALALAASDPPFSLLLTDVVMPEMSGAELALRLRDAQPDLRVLYMSGYTDDVLGPDELRVPHTGFLRKPFGAGDLTAKVGDLLLETAAV